MLDFLKHLFDDGEIIVPRQVSDDGEPVRRLLIVAERIWRQEWPGTAPRFDEEQSARAAAVLYTFCRATVYRELDEQSVAEQLKQIGLAPTNSVEGHYSVDLVLRFLPQVYERLRRTSSSDPVLTLALEVARQWPLSSVGIPDSGPDVLPAAFLDRGVFRVYTDRVVSVADIGRMNLPEVAAAVDATLGPYDNLRRKSGLQSHSQPRSD